MDDIWKPGFASTGHERFKVGYASKFYRGTFRVRNLSRYTLRSFRTATAADQYALEVMVRYGRLLASRPIPQPLPHVEGE